MIISKLLISTIVLLVVLSTVAASFSSALFARPQHFYHKTSHNQNVRSTKKQRSPPTPPTPSSGNVTNLAPVYDVFINLIETAKEGNVTKYLSFFDENVTATFGQGIISGSEFRANVRDFFSKFAVLDSFAIASSFALKGATAGAFFFELATFPQQGSPIISSTLPSIAADSIFVTLNNHLINRFYEFTETPTNSNASSMVSFVTSFIDNLVTKQNIALLNASLSPDFFILTSHDDPDETEVIPKFIFMNFIQQDWKDQKFNTYKISEIHASGNVVAIEFVYIFKFADSTMAKSFACYCTLKEMSTGRDVVPYQVQEMIAVEDQRYA